VATLAAVGMVRGQGHADPAAERVLRGAAAFAPAAGLARGASVAAGAAVVRIRGQVHAVAVAVGLPTGADEGATPLGAHVPARAAVTAGAAVMRVGVEVEAATVRAQLAWAQARAAGLGVRMGARWLGSEAVLALGAALARAAHVARLALRGPEGRARPGEQWGAERDRTDQRGGTTERGAPGDLLARQRAREVVKARVLAPRPRRRKWPCHGRSRASLPAAGTWVKAKPAPPGGAARLAATARCSATRGGLRGRPRWPGAS